MSDPVATEPTAVMPEPPTRRAEWVLVGAAFVLAWPLWNFRGVTSHAGITMNVPITLVTSDNGDLSCALGRAVGDYRCEFDGSATPWSPAPTPDKTLAPYLSESRQMFLIPGLFEEPAVHARYLQELPSGVPRAALQRFTARCKLELVERVEGGFSTRWSRSGKFGPGDVAWVAVPVSCKTTD